MRLSETLARRWLASKHWGGWRVGMVDTGGRVCIRERVPIPGEHGPGHPCFLNESWVPSRMLTVEHIPDLDHPGTRAFLLEDVRKAWGCCVAICPPRSLRPRFWSCEVERVDSGVQYWQRFQARTEAEALMLALEAAP